METMIETGIEKTIENLSSVKKKVQVSVAANQVRERMTTAYGNIQQAVNIDGFRKGKAPMDVIRRNYQEEVEKEVVGDLVRVSLSEVLQDETIHPVTYPVLQDKELAEDGSLKFSVLLEVKPQIEVRNYKKLKLKSELSEPNDENVNEVLERMRDQYSVLEDRPEDVKIAADDYVSVKLELLRDGEVIPNGTFAPETVCVGKKEVLPEIDEALIGMVTGETKTTAVKLPQEIAEKDFAGQELDCNIEVQAVKEKKLPELDDSFARTTGIADSLKALKDKIREDLIAERKKMDQRQLEKAAIEQILSSNPFEVPPSLVDQRFKAIISRVQQNSGGYQPGKAAQDPNAFLESLPKEERERLVQDANRVALEEVRGDLMLDAVSRQEKIEVTEETLNEHIETTFLAAQPDETRREEARKYFNEDSRRFAIREQLLMSKVLDFILSEATIKKS